MVAHQEPSQLATGTPIIVFIARNSVAAAAVNVAANLARGGKDTIVLVTFVPTPMQVGATLGTFKNRCRNGCSKAPC